MESNNHVFFILVEQTIPNLGEELVTRAPNSHGSTESNEFLGKTPQMPLLEPTLPIPLPHHRSNEPVEKSEASKPSNEHLKPSKLDPSTIGNLMNSPAKPESYRKSDKHVSSSLSYQVFPKAPQNHFIPFSNDRDDVRSRPSPHWESILNNDASDRTQDRQLKTVIPSEADPIQELPSFQDIHEMMLFSKKNPKEKQSKIGKAMLRTYFN